MLKKTFILLGAISLFANKYTNNSNSFNPHLWLYGKSVSFPLKNYSSFKPLPPVISSPFDLHQAKTSLALEKGYIIGGEFNQKEFIARLDKNGSFLWGYTLDSLNSKFKIFKRSAWDFYLLSSSQKEGVVGKFELDGTFWWAKRFQSSQPLTLSSIVPLENELIALGEVRVKDGSSNALVMKLDLGGDVIWAKRVFNLSNCHLLKGDTNIKGELFVVGYNKNSLVVMGLTPEGALRWARGFKAPHSFKTPQPLEVKTLEDSLFILFTQGDGDTELMKLDRSGKFLLSTKVTLGDNVTLKLKEDKLYLTTKSKIGVFDKNLNLLKLLKRNGLEEKDLKELLPLRGVKRVMIPQDFDGVKTQDIKVIVSDIESVERLAQKEQ